MFRLIEHTLSILFPPALPEFHVKNDLPETVEYQYRKNRTGMDHSPHVAVGRVVGKAQPKRIILLGPRTSW